MSEENKTPDSEENNTLAAMKKAELELQRLATFDGLTGVYNRRSFNESLIKEWKRAQREKQILSLILLDIDYFKFYNDIYGILAGDDCLRQVAQTVKQTVNLSVELVARYGGEEFAIILANTDQQGAISVVEKIQQAIRTLAIPHQKSKVSEIVSVSFGVASFLPTLDSSPADLMNLVEQALYQAKQLGRDRYCVAKIK